jgi:isopentenyl diphosphate isomerase/L-lactate dehydrogenase-like FMN-dependent dehydrogenase
VSLARCGTIADLRRAAFRRLPKAVFDTIEGGAGDEQALRRNTEALDRVVLYPRVLRDVARVNLTTSILGAPAASPLILAPTGMSGFYRPRGEILAAQAAAEAGVIYGLSTVSSVALEDIASLDTGRRWFQLYPLADRARSEDLVRRAAAAGFEALCVTVDVPLIGRRNRDRANRVSFPPRLGPALIASLIAHPGWTAPFIAGYRPTIANFAPAGERAPSMRRIAPPAMDAAFGWGGLERIRKIWSGPLVVKGVLHPDDARAAEASGADALVVSNHGGRQFDCAPSTYEALVRIVDEAAPSCELYVDGGVRTGADVLKFLTAGAAACLIGRAYLYGLAAYGQAGVTASLQILAEELRGAMALYGAATIADLRAGG